MPSGLLPLSWVWLAANVFGGLQGLLGGFGLKFGVCISQSRPTTK